LKSLLLNNKKLQKKYGLELKHNLENDRLGSLRHHYYDLVMSNVLLEQMYESVKMFGSDENLKSYKQIGLQTFIDSICSFCRNNDLSESSSDEYTQKINSSFTQSKRSFREYLTMMEIVLKSKKKRMVS